MLTPVFKYYHIASCLDPFPSYSNIILFSYTLICKKFVIFAGQESLAPNITRNICFSTDQQWCCCALCLEDNIESFKEN